MGKPNAKFVELWLESYKTFHSDCLGCNSVLMTHKLAEIFPHHIHVEATSFTNPTWMDMPAMYGTKLYNYTNNYAIHMYGEKNYFIPENEEELAGYNCTLGKVMRHVLYGSPKLLDTVHIKNGMKHNEKQK